MQKKPTSSKENPAAKAAPSLPVTLENFDRLPNSMYVRKPIVLALFGFSNATLARRVADGKIPAPKKIGAQMSAWQVGELREAQAAFNDCTAAAPADPEPAPRRGRPRKALAAVA